ncbi:hypothetical protein PSTG_06670 [Puccinia striiformis f. sp. tritici PST-78]|uniref:Uncharacterized protein n=1 Tax=Puccinia striiformis f. sp. tritici PST-78 TaxID=1165861 RepID=A0A0L0VL78_9BASI|nr:hypothetical protein PSTG_06662 [Puccinia striiformis f. sp. tritici PST-78]KNF00046.1 hypothetical protein PSTG_06670 [Puccinia striiformis f. sp. tritici PST-78]
MVNTQQISNQPEGSGQMSITNAEPGLESQQVDNNNEACASKQMTAKGPLSKAVMRLRGGEGHHCCAECCWSVYECLPFDHRPLLTLTTPLYTAAYVSAVVSKSSCASKPSTTVSECVVKT